MEIGVMSLNKSNWDVDLNSRKNDVFGIGLPDPFMDGYQEETLTCCDMIDYMGLSKGSYISIMIDKKFLKKILHSHIIHMRSLMSDQEV